jgi:PAS domain S-box-containing protein
MYTHENFTLKAGGYMDTPDIQQKFFDSSCAVMLRMDTTGLITYINKFGYEHFGFTEDEVIGHHILDTIAPRTESTGRGLEEMFERFREFPLEFQTNFNENIKKDGTRVWFAWTNRAEFDEEGWVDGFLCVGVDITNSQNEALTLRKENAFLKSILNAFDDAVFVTDTEAKLKAYNSAFKTFFPDAMGAFKQRNVMQLIETIANSIPGDDAETFRQTAGDALASGVGALSEHPGSGTFSYNRGGETVPVAWQARPRVISGNFLGLLWIFRRSG